MISEPQIPLVILTLAKLTALMILGLALTPILKTASHRAALWTIVILGIPLVALFVFVPSQLDLLPAYQATAIEEERTPIPTSTPTVIPEISTEVSPSFLETSNQTSESPSDSSFKLPPTATRETSLALSDKTPFPLIPTFYLIGVALALLPLAVSMMRLSFLSKKPANGRPRDLWKKLHGSSKCPPLHFTPSPSAPFACGVFQTRIFLPADAIAWTERRLNSALLHERAHLRRRDPLVRLLATMVRAVFWFHPLVWWSHRHLVLAQEEACDQAVLAAGIAPADYAEDLLGFVTASRYLPAETLAMARWSQLGKRVRRVLASTTTTPRKSLAPFVTGALLFVIALASTGFADDPVTEPTETTFPKPVAEPTLESLEKSGKATESELIAREEFAPLPRFAGWNPIDVEGQEFVPLTEVTRFYRFEMDGPGTLKTKSVTLNFEADNLRADFNDVLCNLSHPPIIIDSEMLISETDLVTLIDPVLRPSKVRGTSQFTTVIVEPVRDAENDPDDRLLAIAQELERPKLRPEPKIISTRSEAGSLSEQQLEALTQDASKTLMIRLIAGNPETLGIQSSGFAKDPRRVAIVACGLHWPIVRELTNLKIMVADEGFGASAEPVEKLYRSPVVEIQIGGLRSAEVRSAEDFDETVASGIVKGLLVLQTARRAKSE